MKRHFQYSRRHKSVVAFVSLAACMLVLVVSRHTAVTRPAAFSSFGLVQTPVTGGQPLPPATSDTNRLETARRQYDSLDLARPGFIDSIRIALHYYSLLQK